MNRQYFWCDACQKAHPESALSRIGSTFLCPDCKGLFLPAVMQSTECPSCGATMRHRLDEKFLCPCQTVPTPSLEPVAPVAPVAPPLPVQQSADAPLPAGLRPARVLSWQPSHRDAFTFRHPDGEDLMYGDHAVLTEGQCLLYLTGGKPYWFLEAQSYPLGYEQRSEADRLVARMQGYTPDGVPDQIATHVLFFDLHKHPGFTMQTTPILLPCRMAATLSLGFSLTLIDPDALMRNAFPDILPEDGLLARQAEERLDAAVHQALTHRYDSFTSVEEVRDDLNANRDDLCRQIAAAVHLEADFGLALADVTLTGYALETTLCPECSTPVRTGDAFCQHGHRLHWCPVCGSQIADGRCSKGHPLMWCRFCDAYKHAPKGVCPVHSPHGKG